MEHSVSLTTPIEQSEVEKLRIGMSVHLNGFIYTARDAAHQRLITCLHNKTLPFDLHGQIIYYTGPTPGMAGRPVGSAGPTSSYRMDPYTPELVRNGLKGMIGKGPRNRAVKAAIKKYQAVYFAAIGGAGALIAKSILSADVIAYPELGTEAIRRMKVKDFRVIVAIDVTGAELYEAGRRQWALPRPGGPSL